MKVGSEEHKRLFCQSFMDQHRVYQPETMTWPALDAENLDRLRRIPFWDEALYTERRAGEMLAAFSQTISDPMLQEAIALQGREEARHGQMLRYLIDRYQIQVPERAQKPLPSDLDAAFVKFGYGECFDSFFAFGLFEVARQAGLMSEAFFTIFDPILDEEARHMVFFVNWVAYKQVQEGRELLRPIHSFWQYTGALQRRLDNLTSSTKKTKKSSNKKGFTAAGAPTFTFGLTLDKFLETCRQENTRRMSSYDERLLRPDFLPIVTGLALPVIKLLPSKKKPASLANAA